MFPPSTGIICYYVHDFLIKNLFTIQMDELVKVGVAHTFPGGTKRHTSMAVVKTILNEACEVHGLPCNIDCITDSLHKQLCDDMDKRARKGPHVAYSQNNLHEIHVRWNIGQRTTAYFKSV
jgi:hypothetical protein